MRAKYFVINHSTQRQAVESGSEFFPDFGVAVHTEAFVIKSVHLRRRDATRKNQEAKMAIRCFNVVQQGYICETLFGNLIPV